MTLHKSTKRRLITRWLMVVIISCIVLWIIWDYVCFFLFDIGLSSSWRQNQLDTMIIMNLSIKVDGIDKIHIKDPNSIIFIKTFKTAGSTLLSIFHNYCVLRNKSCPITKPYFLWRTWDFNQFIIEMMFINLKHGIIKLVYIKIIYLICG